MTARQIIEKRFRESEIERINKQLEAEREGLRKREKKTKVLNELRDKHATPWEF